MSRQELADYINIRIGEADITISELARQSGVARSEIYKILKCQTTPSIDILRRLSIPLKVHNSALIGKLHSGYIRPLPRNNRTLAYMLHDVALVRDVTYPDNSIILVNQEFEKIWELQNVGKKPFEGFTLACVDDPNMPARLTPANDSYEVAFIEPMRTIELAISFTAPSFAGTVISRWKMFDGRGQIVFPEKEGIWCQVQVVDD